MREAVLNDIVDLINAVEPDLPRSTIHQVVDDFVAKAPQGKRLLALLESDPNALTAGSPRIPTSLARILLALTDSGATMLRAPGCAHCGRVVLLNGRDGEDGICAACDRARRVATIRCHDCGQQKKRYAAVGDHDYCRPCWSAMQPSAASRIARFTGTDIPHHITPDRTDAAVASLGLKADRKLRLALECELFGADWITRPAAASMLFAGFYDALRAQGATLAPRTCGHCGLDRTLTGRLEGLICCRRCYSAGHRAPCDGCGETRILEVRRPDGSRLCQTCTNLLDGYWAVCIGCGNRRLIASHTAEGPMCSTCRTAPATDTCTNCGATGECRFPGTDKTICLACYAAARVDVCTRCGVERECRHAGTEKAICIPCTRRREPCSSCGRATLPTRHTPEGAPLCWACVPAIIEPCLSCGALARVSVRTEHGPLCQRCARTSPLMFRDCHRCGSHARLHKGRRCDRCYADDKIRDLLPDELVATDPALARLRDRCLAADPRRTIIAFKRNTTIAKLRAVLSSSKPLSHDLLDSLGNDSETSPVRSLLVEHELLPPRDETLVRFERWCNEMAATITGAAHRRAFEQFARWRPLRELREQSRPVSTGQSGGRRDELRQIADLLEWLTSRSEQLSDLDQARLDLWLTDGSPRRRRTANFLRWAAQNRLCPRLAVAPDRKPARNPIGASIEERWALLERLLNPDATDPRTALAGVLVLLFGIRVIKLRELRVTDIIEQHGKVSILLGPDPLELPGDIGRLALAARDRRDAPRLLSDESEALWLFPGRRHGTPLSRDGLTNRLNALGIHVRPTRTGALVSLVQELPVPVIARLTGLSIAAATGWSEAVAASHARYTGLLALP